MMVDSDCVAAFAASTPLSSAETCGASHTCSLSPCDSSSSDGEVVVAASETAAFEAPLDMFADSDDEPVPSSPSKSARRRMRRRRQRDAIRAAMASEANEEGCMKTEVPSNVTLDELGMRAPEQTCSQQSMRPTLFRPPPLTMTPTASAMPSSRCFPRASFGGVVSLPCATSGMSAPLGCAVAASPCNATSCGVQGVMSTSPCGGTVVRGDASARTPTSSALQPPSVNYATRNLSSAVSSVMVAQQRQVEFRAVGSAMAASPNTPVQRTLQMLLGNAGLALSKEELVAHLEAAAPDVYED
eukprot:TRINITY_DN7276_c0_g2_i1.p1 TRINITY_DN7276_c0_g2~~TRINITY_DN7276_c0_g2_i1.p1  ORF type:complete len:344 (-),score=37.21 TRINITY_DN7276_c0_g2_i1:435-1334(-)